ncbi:MAG: hypothetical protein WC687_01000 [Patescibacteria group bacterium]
MEKTEKTAFAVLHMSRHESSSPQANYGLGTLGPMDYRGIPVRYHPNSFMRDSGYRMLEIQLPKNQNEAGVAMAVMHAGQIRGAISSLQDQLNSLTPEKISHYNLMINELLRKGYLMHSQVLYFKPWQSGLVAKYGWGINGSGGMVMFGQNNFGQSFGVQAGHQLVQVVFRPTPYADGLICRYGWGITVCQPESIKRVLSGLRKQLDNAVFFQEHGCLLEDFDRPSLACRLIARQATHACQQTTA